MSIKSEVLRLLLDADGEYISGQAIGEQLFCSRNAIWKAIHSLKSDGYDIKSVTNKGYALCGGDVFSVDGIHKYLSESAQNVPVVIKLLSTTTSTNDMLKIEAEHGADEGFVIVADKQTSGKGRRGRSFFSPDSGLYLSILLRPKISANDALMITTAAAVAVASAIESVCGKVCGIKWVNDIFLDGLKICGILTEAAVDFESGGLQYAVLGIGINLAHPNGEFPPELSEIAGAIYDDLPKNHDIKNKLCACVISNFFEIYKALPDRSFMNEYRKKSFVTGKDIYVISQSGKVKAKALEIDDNAGLKVQYENGEIATVSTGEVSIRLDK